MEKKKGKRKRKKGKKKEKKASDDVIMLFSVTMFQRYNVSAFM